MSENIFESLPEHLIIEELDTSLMTGNGDLLSVQGKTNVTISFAGHEFNASVVVAKLGGLSVIIGLDFLVKCNGILYSPHFGEVPLLREDWLHSRCARVHLAETVSVPGSSEMFVQGKITDKCPSDIDALLEPELDDKMRNRILMAKSGVKTNESIVTFSVFNPTEETLILKKNARGVSLQTIDSVLECNHMQNKESHLKSVDAETLPDHLRPLLVFYYSTRSVE